MSRISKMVLLAAAAAGLALLFLVLRPDPEPHVPSPSPSEASIVAVDVEVADGRVPGRKELDVPLGAEILLTVTSDVADEVHVHGYDVMADVEPGTPVELAFTADVPGVFEVELEDEGLLLIELTVTP